MALAPHGDQRLILSRPATLHIGLAEISVVGEHLFGMTAAAENPWQG
jgi:hypothetical protein